MHRYDGTYDFFIHQVVAQRNSFGSSEINYQLYAGALPEFEPLFDFIPVEFDGIRKQAGLNSFTLTPKQWIEKAHARGIVSKPGRYGGTFAHKDIAFEFASWISVEFKLYLIKEFQRLKEKERKQLGWDIRRNLAKINYRIHTDAIKENLVPPQLTGAQINGFTPPKQMSSTWPCSV